MLPERIVFGDRDGALEARRDVTVAHPLLQMPGRLALVARLTGTELHERRRCWVDGSERPHVGQRQVHVDEERETQSRQNQRAS